MWIYRERFSSAQFLKEIVFAKLDFRVVLNEGETQLRYIQFLS